MINGLGEAVLISLAGVGLTFDKVDETQESLTMYISVPSSSYHVDARGREMSGDYLAKRVKQTMVEMGVKRLTVKYRIRNEHWTKEKKEAAELNARKQFFGSQY